MKTVENHWLCIGLILIMVAKHHSSLKQHKLGGGGNIKNTLFIQDSLGSSSLYQAKSLHYLDPVDTSAGCCWSTFSVHTIDPSLSFVWSLSLAIWSDVNSALDSILCSWWGGTETFRHVPRWCWLKQSIGSEKGRKLIKWYFLFIISIIFYIFSPPSFLYSVLWPSVTLSFWSSLDVLYHTESTLHLVRMILISFSRARNLNERVFQSQIWIVCKMFPPPLNVFYKEACFQNC